MLNAKCQKAVSSKLHFGRLKKKEKRKEVQDGSGLRGLIINGHKGRNPRYIIIAKGFNIPLTSMNTSSRQKINKKIMALIVILDQIDLIDI